MHVSRHVNLDGGGISAVYQLHILMSNHVSFNISTKQTIDGTLHYYSLYFPKLEYFKSLSHLTIFNILFFYI